VVFAGWLFEKSSSSSGNSCLALGQSSGSGDGHLVLATVLYWLPFWCLLGREDIRKERRVKNKVAT